MKNLRTGDVKCPTCGGELEEHDCVDIEVDVSRVRLFKVGACPYCGNHYQWHEEFTYEGYISRNLPHHRSALWYFPHIASISYHYFSHLSSTFPEIFSIYLKNFLAVPDAL